MKRSKFERARDGAIKLFLESVRQEILRAQRLFPSNSLATIALTEEVGELAKAVLDESADDVRTEAVQVAAMAFRVGVEGDRSADAHRNRRHLAWVGSPIWGPGSDTEKEIIEVLEKQKPLLVDADAINKMLKRLGGKR